jgi:hypothetical protein
MQKGCCSAQCGTALPAGAKFYLECGQPVSTPPGRSSSSRAYPPKHLAEKILGSRSALEGERKQVTTSASARCIARPATV